jgi:hypothetical protein
MTCCWRWGGSGLGSPVVESTRVLARAGRRLVIRAHLRCDGPTSISASARSGLVMARGRVFEKMTKSDRVRVVSLGPATVEALAVHRDRARALASRLGGELSEESFVFASSRPGSTEAYRPDTVTETFERLRRAGLDRV